MLGKIVVMLENPYFWNGIIIGVVVSGLEHVILSCFSEIKKGRDK